MHFIGLSIFSIVYIAFLWVLHVIWDIVIIVRYTNYRRNRFKEIIVEKLIY